MVYKEVDHLKWVNKVKDLFIENATALEVQLDHTKCGLGKFLYGGKGRILVNNEPALSPFIEAIKAPHARLHASAKKINEIVKEKRSQPGG